MLIEEVVRACLASVKAFQRLQHDYNEHLEDRNWAGYKRAVLPFGLLGRRTDNSLEQNPNRGG